MYCVGDRFNGYCNSFSLQIEELIPNGSNVAVTNENRIEYIYRMADYKLNKQIAKQIQAFKKG